MLKINKFSITQLKKTSWIFLHRAAFYNFRVFLLLPDASRDFAGVHLDRKGNRNFKVCVSSEL